MPLSMIGEAVFARCLSAQKDDRVQVTGIGVNVMIYYLKASKLLPGPTEKWTGDRQKFIDAVRDALYASKMVSYTQGYILMR
jgi:6-phosphogluconate dehydrogenase